MLFASALSVRLQLTSPAFLRACKGASRSRCRGDGGDASGTPAPCAPAAAAGVRRAAFSARLDAAFAASASAVRAGAAGPAALSVCGRQLRVRHLLGQALYQCSLGDCTTTTAIELNGKGLYGTIPVSVGLLSNLVVLDVANNSLTGHIPTNIGSMEALQVLRLDGNRLTGTIPSGIGLADALTTVDLLGNELTGALPAAIGLLVNLKSLDLSQNRLDGAVPASFCALQGIGARVAVNNLWCNSEYAVNYENVMKGDFRHGRQPLDDPN